VVKDAALSAEFEVQRISGHTDVAISECSEPERLVRAGVLLVTDAHERRVEKFHDCRQHPLTRQPGLAQILRDASSNPR